MLVTVLRAFLLALSLQQFQRHDGDGRYLFIAVVQAVRLDLEGISMNEAESEGQVEVDAEAAAACQAKVVIHEGTSQAEGGAGDWIVMEGPGCSPEELTQEVDCVMLSGTDTYASEQSGGLFFLVIHGTQSEVQSILGGCRSEGRSCLASENAIVETDTELQVVGQTEWGKKPSDAGLDGNTSDEDLDTVWQEAPNASKNGTQELQKLTLASSDPTRRVPVHQIQQGPPWNLDRIDQRKGQNQRYTFSYTGRGVHIYIMDTGIRTTHEQFEDRAHPAIEVLSRSDPTTCPSYQLNKYCSQDRNGHGTHAAGIAAGWNYGVAKQATLHAVKMMDDRGKGKFTWFLIALSWVMAAERPRPKVISASVAGRLISQTFVSAITEATNAGVLVVVAAGNHDEDACLFSPARVPDALTIGATDMWDAMPSWSNHGPCVDILAPGEFILSASSATDVGGIVMDGTSMAAPHVSGAAALLLEESPTRTPREVSALIKGAATPLREDATFGTDTLLYVGQDHTTFSWKDFFNAIRGIFKFFGNLR